MPTCRLCHKDRMLRESHVIPKFLYLELKNSKRQIMGVTGLGNKGWEPVQDGAKEHLFCEDCEQHLNRELETPFRKFWQETSPLPDPWADDSPRQLKVDYNRFKLFHLSILFRASLCTLPMFSEVSLGPHEENIRKLVLNLDLTEAHMYPVAGYAIVHHKTRELIKMVSKPQAFKLGGRRCYGIMYGGAEWWFCVASDRNPEFEAFALKGDGQLHLSVFPWNEVAAVQKASLALRKTEA